MSRVFHQKSPATIKLARGLRKLPISMLWRASCILGDMAWYGNRKRRKQLIRIFDRLCERAGLKEPANVICRRFYRSQIMLLCGQYILPAKSPGDWQKIMDVEGFEPVQEHLVGGRGVLVVLMHFGAHILFLAHLDRAGFTAVPVRPYFYEEYESPEMQEMLYLHKGVLYVGESAGLASPVRTAVRHLKDGHPVGITPDGELGAGETKVPIFGGELPVRIGALEMARLAKCPMVFVHTWIENGRYRMRYHPMRDFSDLESPEETLRLFWEEAVRTFETAIREHPECIIWTPPMLSALGLEKKKGVKAAKE